MIVDNLSKFLLCHLDLKRPILLALSGGVDSTVLLEILLELKKTIPFQLGIAHVDHRWRASSSREAAALAILAKRHQLEFHLKTLSPQELRGNLEAACRHERLAFFKQVCEAGDYQAVLLAHHSDDLVETILKKLFEGAPLTSIPALSQCVLIDGVELWRPLLTASREEICTLANERKLNYFQDETNEDQRFLRARMRSQMIPYLEQLFGKKVKKSLLRLADEAEELKNYLDQKLLPLLKSIEKGVSAVFFDFTPFFQLPQLELAHLLRLFLREYNIFLPHKLFDEAIRFVTTKVANKKLTFAKKNLLIDRGCFFLLDRNIEQKDFAPTPLPNRGESMECSGWKIEVTNASEEREQLSDWRAFFRGRSAVTLPLGNYQVAPAKGNMPYPHRSLLRKWWNENKVPAFLRTNSPLIIGENGQIAHEFLSGRQTLSPSPCAPNITIALSHSLQREI